MSEHTPGPWQVSRNDTHALLAAGEEVLRVARTSTAAHHDPGMIDAMAMAGEALFKATGREP